MKEAIRFEKHIYTCMILYYLRIDTLKYMQQKENIHIRRNLIAKSLEGENVSEVSGLVRGHAPEYYPRDGRCF